MTELPNSISVNALKSVVFQGKPINLRLTGEHESGAFMNAFGCENVATGEKYFLKISEKGPDSGSETKALVKVNQIFKNEVLTESDPSKRLNYVPAPRVIADTIDKFNPEFAQGVDSQKYWVQLQTAAEGYHCEQKMPTDLNDRLAIALDLAKLLRECAKNKIAYVDIKPLEHLFWNKADGKIKIILIDWDIARLNSESFYLWNDIRKFCMMLPEIIYGEKMLDIQNRGRYEYPIQKENRRAIISLLGKLSCSGPVPPLLKRFSVLTGDLLVAPQFEIRFQNRAGDVWDEIIQVISQAISDLASDKNPSQTKEELQRNCDSILIDKGPALISKDLDDQMGPRLCCLSSYKAWLIPAITFLQSWVVRTDIVSIADFDNCLKAVVNNDISEAQADYKDISNKISEKIFDSFQKSEFTGILMDSLQTISQCLDSWKIVNDHETGKVQPEILKEQLKTLPVRLYDPIINDLYINLTAEAPKQNLPTPAEVHLSGNVSEVKPPEEKRVDTPVNEMVQKAELPSEIVDRLIHRVEKNDNFMILVPTDFFYDLDRLAKMGIPDAGASKKYEFILSRLVSAVEVYTRSISPSWFISAEEILIKCDWVRFLTPAVCSKKIFWNNAEKTVFEIINDAAEKSDREILDALNEKKEQPAGNDLYQKFEKLMADRRRLNAYNLVNLQKMTDSNNFDEAEKIVNLHFNEAPNQFSQIREDIILRRADANDRKTIGVMNSVLNDLYSGNTRFETEGYIQNRKNIPIASQRINDFKKRDTQIFDIQDNVSRSKNQISEIYKTLHNLKFSQWFTMVMSILALLFSIGILFTILVKNESTTQNIKGIESELSEFKATYAAEKLIQPTPIIITVIPTILPTSTMAPTETPSEIQRNMGSETAIPSSTKVASLNPADSVLDNYVGKTVKFGLPGNLSLYSGSDLKTELGKIVYFDNDASGALVGYTDQAINLEISFNIVRSQISTDTYLTVKAGTNVRKFTEPPSNSTLTMVTSQDIQLVSPATGCTTTDPSFCHGTISVWVERKKVESSIK